MPINASDGDDVKLKGYDGTEIGNDGDRLKVVGDDLITNQLQIILLRQIIHQLKIQNLHLETISGIEYTEGDEQ